MSPYQRRDVQRPGTPAPAIVVQACDAGTEFAEEAAERLADHAHADDTAYGQYPLGVAPAAAEELHDEHAADPVSAPAEPVVEPPVVEPPVVEPSVVEPAAPPVAEPPVVELPAVPEERQNV